MSTIILTEVILTLVVAWCIKHEEKFVAFEDKIIFAVLRKIRYRKGNRR